MVSKLRIGLVPVLLLIVAALLYATTPTMAFGFAGMHILVLAVCLGGMVLTFEEYSGNRPAFAFGAGLVAYLVLCFVMTLEMGRSDTFRDLVGQREFGKFTQDVAPIDVAQIRVVDQEMARRIGEKLLGEESALGSSAKLGTMAIQHVAGRLYWVAPVLHSGFFAWNKFSDGTPGYVKVSATNPNDFEFVRKVGGKDVRIRYQPEAYFGDDLERHLWLNGFASVGLTDFTFEIDDEGNPFYVVTLYGLKIGWSGEDAVGVAVVDVRTGEIRNYPIDKAPQWIDRIQPDDFVFEQLKLWGEYQDGWLNLSGNKKLKPAHEPLFVHGSDGRGYWYVGISSKGKEGAITGFAMVDSRTKAFKFYEVAGTTESAAQQSVLGKVREKNYAASNPVLYNVAGHPTYVMSLKDGAGLVKMVGMADVRDHSVVGVGDTVRDALRSYLSAQNAKGNAAVPDAHARKASVSGTVERIGTDVRGGNSLTYFTVSGQSGKAFVADTGISPDVAVTRVGDSVDVEFVAASPLGYFQASAFRNRTLGISPAPAQVAKTAETEAVRDRAQRRQDVREADSKWEKLAPEEKAEALGKLDSVRKK